MSRWLTCAICGQRKPVGIMSAQAWGKIETNPKILYACPDCQQKHTDWRDQLERQVPSSS